MGKLSRRRGNRRHARLRDKLPRPRNIAGRLLGAISRNRRAVVAVTVVATAVGGAIGARAWLTSSPRFAIDRVDIDGAKRAPAAAIATRLAVADRPNLFLYDIDAAIARLEASPWIRRAEIRRDLPDGLSIAIEERAPKALLVVDGALYLTEATGVPFKRATADEAVGLKLVAITGLTREALGADGPATTALIRRAITLADHWNDKSRPAVGEINIDPVRGFTAITRDHAITVRLGTGDSEAIDGRLRLFDRTWKALDSGERLRVAMIHLDQAARPQRASVAFEPERATTIETSPWAN